MPHVFSKDRHNDARPHFAAAKLSQGAFFSSMAYPRTDEEIEQLLEQRDRDAFSSRWMTAYRQLEAEKVARPLDHDAAAMIDKLRELAYLQSFQRWQSPDLAAYVSDDFGVIGEMLSVNGDDAWVTTLLQAYQDGRVPGSAL